MMYNSISNKETFVGIDLPISSANINKTGYMLNERVKYTAKTTRAIVDTANSNLDGTGTVVELVRGPDVLLKRIIIEAQSTTTKGMIRFFHYQSGTYRLYFEVNVDEVTPSATNETFVAVIDGPFYLHPSSDYRIYASTEKGETFIITAESVTISYP